MKPLTDFFYGPTESDRPRSLIAPLLGSRFGRETVGSIGLKVGSVGLAFITTVLLTRLLGPTSYGVYSYVIALVTLLSVPSEFGLPTLVVRETARGIVNQDHEAVQGVWRWSSRTTAIISLVLVLLTIAGLWLFKEPITSPRLITFLWALALVPLIALGDLRGAALRGLHRVVAGQLPEFLLRPGIYVLFLAAIVFIGRSSLSAPMAMMLYVAASALSFGAGAVLLWRATPLAVRQARPSPANRAWLLSALPLAFIGGMQLINNQASILLQGFFLKDAQIGIFRVASQVAGFAGFGLDGISLVVMPRFAALHAGGNMKKLQRLVKASTRVALSFNLVLTAGFVVLGKPFLTLVFGADYRAAYVPLLVLMGGELINSATGLVGVLLNMSGFERTTAKARLVASILTIGLNLILMPVWGIIGSAIADAIAMIVWNIMLWWAVKKNLGINSFAF